MHEFQKTFTLKLSSNFPITFMRPSPIDQILEVTSKGTVLRPGGPSGYLRTPLSSRSEAEGSSSPSFKEGTWGESTAGTISVFQKQRPLGPRAGPALGYSGLWQHIYTS